MAEWRMLLRADGFERAGNLAIERDAVSGVHVARLRRFARLQHQAAREAVKEDLAAEFFANPNLTAADAQKRFAEIIAAAD